VLQLHIEQGPVLEQVGFPLGVVKGIAGQTRLKVKKYYRHVSAFESSQYPKIELKYDINDKLFCVGYG
jgi:hypothetical protein